jgi:DNA polymerase-3 subunit beta
VKIVAHAGTLADSLALAAAARPSKKTSALSAVRIVASEGAISVTRTDNSIAITAKAAAEVIEPGKAAIAADRLASLTAGFATGEKVTIGTDENLVTIVCGNSRSRLPVVSWDDLPAALAIDEEIGRIEVSGADCVTLLEPLQAASSEVTRFHLCGIFWHSIDDRLVAVATDGIRLIRTCIAAGKFSEDRDLIVPREAAAALARLVKGTRPGKLTLRRSRTLLAVDGPAFTFISRLIDGQYPVYEAVIPSALRTSVTFVRAELLAALSRLVAVATIEPPLLALSFDGSSDLNVFLARQPDDGSDLIAAEATGNAKVAVAPSQLAAMLSEFSSMHLRIEAATGQPIVIRGDGEKIALISQCAWNFDCNEKEEAA